MSSQFIRALYDHLCLYLCPFLALCLFPDIFAENYLYRSSQNILIRCALHADCADHPPLFLYWTSSQIQPSLIKRAIFSSPQIY